MIQLVNGISYRLLIDSKILVVKIRFIGLWLLLNSLFEFYFVISVLIKLFSLNMVIVELVVIRLMFSVFDIYRLFQLLIVVCIMYISIQYNDSSQMQGLVSMQWVRIVL